MGAELANHLWQSTLCVAGAALLVRMLKGQSARWRYRVWLAASLKFFVPFALLSAAGARLPLPILPDSPSSQVSVVVEFLGQPFGTGANDQSPIADDQFFSNAQSSMPNVQSGIQSPASPSVPLLVLVSLWAGGCLALTIGRVMRWRRLRVLLRSSQSLTRGREADALERTKVSLLSGRDVEICAMPTLVEPGVVGITRPVILWPLALSARLNDRELDAIFAHELQHVHRRDNLAAALHSLLETVFWFHPVIWWLKTRLIAERERACDEAVLQLGSEPHAYARGILKVCEFCLQSPSIAAAAVTGADLTRRMEDIMSERKASSLTLTHRLLLAFTALAVIVGPMAAGSLQASTAATPFTPQPGTWRAAVVSAAAPFDVAVAPVQSTTSRVSGVVTDVRGGGVADATVSAAPEGGGAGPKIQTGANGAYSLDLPPGQYELTISKPGFASTKQAVFVARGITLQRDVRLNMGSVSESINIKAGPPPPPPSPEALAEMLDRARALIQRGSLVAAERELSLAMAGVRAARASANPPTQQSAAAGPGQVRVGGEVSPPKKIKDVAPLYPQQAREAKVSGIVIIDATIGTDGLVKNAMVLRGQPLLDQAALDAVSQWQFTPTTLNGAPVEVLMSVTVNFQLQ
jgi:TonB family protein